MAPVLGGKVVERGQVRPALVELRDRLGVLGSEDIALVEAEHRDHAVVEQAIADLKDQALQHFPSGHFYANGAWTVLAALGHNLLRWTQLIGLPDTTVRAARTLRRRLLSIPGRLTSHARGWTLHLPARWPWHGDYISALNAIRALAAAA